MLTNLFYKTRPFFRQENLDRARQLYNADDVFGRGDDNGAAVVKRKSMPSGFYGARGRRAEEDMADMSEQPQEHADLMSLLEYYRALHNNKRTMLGKWGR